MDDTGHYGSGKTHAVEAIDDCLEKIEVGTFVAVHLANYDGVPVIGKVLKVSESMVKIHYWKDLLRGSGVHKMCPAGRRHGLMSSPKRA